MATVFSLRSDPAGVFGPTTGALEGIEALNAAGYTARPTDEQPRGPYRRYETAAPLEVVEELPGLVDGSVVVAPGAFATQEGQEALLERAYRIADMIVTVDGADVDLLALARSTRASAERLLGHALVLANRRFLAVETTFVCSWCQLAAATPVALAAHSADEIREHGPRCGHNPLTQAVRLHFAALDSQAANAAATEQHLRRFAGCPEVGS